MATVTRIANEVSIRLSEIDLNLVIRGLAEAAQGQVPEEERQALRALVLELSAAPVDDDTESELCPYCDGSGRCDDEFDF